MNLPPLHGYVNIRKNKVREHGSCESLPSAKPQCLAQPGAGSCFRIALERAPPPPPASVVICIIPTPDMRLLAYVYANPCLFHSL